MDLNQRLWDLWQIDEADRAPAIKVLTTLYSKILSDPNNPRFRDLNFSKIRRKFEKAKPAFYLLYTAGFGQSVDGSRLQFKLQNMKMLEAANIGLNAKIANPDDPKLLPKSQKPKEPKSPNIKNKAFKNKYASSSSQTKQIVRQNSSNNENNDTANDTTVTTTANNTDKDTEMTDNTNNNTNNNNENKSDDNDATPKIVDTRTEEEKAIDATEVKNALEDLGDDIDMDLLSQIQASKDTTVSLNMAELVGKTKEEKLAIFASKQKQFRKEKKQAARMQEIDRERKRRDNVKMAQDAKLKRQEQQIAMLAAKKKREKQEAKLRKQRIKEKIKLEKERKAREKAIEQKKKEEAAAKAQGNA